MAETKALPKWATSDRRNALVQLFLSSGGFCVFGHKKCVIPQHNYYLFTEYLIQDWKQLDRLDSQAEWEAELKYMHNLGERAYPTTGRFNAISRDIFADQQPVYYLDGQAVSGLTLKPFVRVRIASSYIRLYIDLGEALREVSKSKRRKAIRYNKPLPQEVDVKIRKMVLEAVRDYLAH